MSSWKMLVDFEALREIEKELELIAEHVQGIAEESKVRIISGLKAAWVGENADAFVKKEVKLINRLNEVARNLNETAMQLDEKAEQISELEKSNVLTAKTRTY